MPSQTAQTGDAYKIAPSSLEVRAVLPETAVQAWPAVEPLISSALRRGQGDESAPEHVLARVIKGESQMWVVVEGDEVVATTVLTVLDAPNTRKLSVDILAGVGMPRWVDRLEELIVRFMRTVNATCIEASCRPGLAARLKQRGWRQKAVIMELT